MGLPVNDKNKKNKGGNQKSNAQSGSKFISKPSNSKGASAQRPHKAGGTRGS